MSHQTAWPPPPTTTNVARLYHAALDPKNGAPHEAGCYRYYMPGVGTEFKEIGEFTPQKRGLTMAEGGENRINWGLTRLLDAVGIACGDDPMEAKEAYDLVKAMAVSKTADMLGAGQNSGQAKRQAAMEPEMTRLAAKVEALREDKSAAEIIGIRVFVYGFSRGAAQARTFANWLEQLTRVDTDVYQFAGVPISIAFLGIFETVASVGVAYLAPFTTGHMSWASGTMRLPDSQVFLERCVHIIGAHEQRGCFPLDSIRRKANPTDPDSRSTYRAGTFEYMYPGVHSDVGGGYPPGDQGKAREGGHRVISQIALHHMYMAAYKCGAPLQVPGEILNGDQKLYSPWLAMDPSVFASYDFSAELVTRFNAWQKQLKTGTLEEVMDSEVEKLTAWRIERYAQGGMAEQDFYKHVSGNASRDMTKAERRAFAHLHSLEMEEQAVARGEKPRTVRYASEEERIAAEARAAKLKTDSEAIKAQYENKHGPYRLNTHKAFEPSLDGRQLREGALDFRRDYYAKWDLDEDPMQDCPLNDGSVKKGFQWATVANASLGGLIYLTNEQDEAAEYRRMHDQGRHYYPSLFTPARQPVNEEAALLIALYDDQVHDSRAWFMHAALNGREVFSDYFRYRAVFFDGESNKSLSLLARGGQFIGVGIAAASIGLTIKRGDPRYLLGLALPSLATPAMRGHIGMPELTAFDNLTGVAIPMLSGLEAVHAFTKDTGSVLQLAQALPLPVPLTEETANTPELQTMLKAAQAAEAAKQAKETGDFNALIGQTAEMLDQGDDSPLAGKAGLLNQVRDAVTMR